MPTATTLATLIAEPTRRRLGGRQLTLAENLPRILTELRVLEPELADPSIDQVRTALRRLQKHDGIEVTGELDDDTLAAINASRCLSIGSVSSALVTQEDLEDLCGATVPVIRYAFQTGTNDVAGDGELDAARQALRTLSRSGTPIWVEVEETDPDLTVSVNWTNPQCGHRDMRRRTLPDGTTQNTIAHADFFGGCGSGNDVPKPIDMDDAEPWTDDPVAQPGRFDIESVMLHEAGHIVGLQHDGVNRPGVMADSFNTGEIRREFKNDDLVQVRHLYGGTFETHKMRNGEVGSLRQSQQWTSGWSIAETFRIGTQPYLFLLKHSDGDVKIFELGVGGTVGRKTFDSGWTTGWTTAEFFTLKGTTYLFLMKERGVSGSGKTVHVHRMNSDGTVGDRVDSKTWTEGWSTAQFFESGDQTFLFLLKERGSGGDGNNMHVNRINADGTIGDVVDSQSWTEGWTTAETFEAGGNPYIFILKARGVSGSNFTTQVHRIGSDGSIGDRVEGQRWTEGWTTAEFVTHDRDQYLFLLKAAGVGGDGTNVHIHRMNRDGTIGQQTGTATWDEGFTSLVFFEQDASLYAGALKISRPR